MSQRMMIGEVASDDIDGKAFQVSRIAGFTNENPDPVAGSDKLANHGRPYKAGAARDQGHRCRVPDHSPQILHLSPNITDKPGMSILVKLSSTYSADKTLTGKLLSNG
jgi:hypothetical protein